MKFIVNVVRLEKYEVEAASGAAAKVMAKTKNDHAVLIDGGGVIDCCAVLLLECKTCHRFLPDLARAHVEKARLCACKIGKAADSGIW